MPWARSAIWWQDPSKPNSSDIATQCMLSVPTVVSGKDYELYPLADGLRIQVSRSFEEALVWMTLDLHGG